MINIAEYKGNNNLIGKQFGRLTVIDYVGDSKWKCQCKCGNITITKTSKLNNGSTKSCGCLRGESCKGNTRNMKPKKDLTGKKIGMLTPLYYLKGGKWHCKCDCGNECDIDTRFLNNGHTKSCGCYLKKINSLNNTFDMTGYENETIKVLERVGSDLEGIATWKCLCKSCGNTFITRGVHIRNGDTQSCGCLKSRNEKAIIKMLIENNIEFIPQYTFTDLKGLNYGTLRFDFAIFKNNKLSHLIEYNGEQHYKRAKNKWGDYFETQIINDHIKQQYCIDHNIELRIIRYDQEYSLEDLI